ncbi:MAG: hypothetical protein CMO01_23575 [Thalassobius sp.]|nr:hypothetical protein [Thalassovita sp.]
MEKDNEKHQKGKAVDLNQIDFDKLKESTTENPGVLPYAHNNGSAVIKPEDKGKIKGRSVKAMHQQTDLQMQQLYEQMRLLAEQANAIKSRVQVSERIYLADIPFDPLIGEVYYLYQKNQDTDVLSLIGPKEWGRSKPFEKYIATVKMLADHTWDILDKSEDLI